MSMNLRMGSRICLRAKDPESWLSRCGTLLPGRVLFGVWSGTSIVHTHSFGFVPDACFVSFNHHSEATFASLCLILCLNRNSVLYTSYVLSSVSRCLQSGSGRMVPLIEAT